MEGILKEIVHIRERIGGENSCKLPLLLHSFTQSICNGEKIGFCEALNKTENIFGHSVTNATAQQIREMSNLKDAFLFTESLLIEADTNHRGLLTVQLIEHIHFLLMVNLVSDFNTPPGRFSTQTRYTVFNGIVHYYPAFKKTDEIEERVQILVDQYNKEIAHIKLLDVQIDKYRKLVNLAAWFVSEFLALHPFSDGNGRLTRILCNYLLRSEIPFNVPLQNGGGQNELAWAIIKDRSMVGYPNVKRFITMSIYKAWKRVRDLFRR